MGNFMKYNLKVLFLSEEGATAVEYAIMASLIAAVIAGTVGLIGNQVNSMFQAVVSVFNR